MKLHLISLLGIFLSRRTGAFVPPFSGRANTHMSLFGEFLTSSVDISASFGMKEFVMLMTPLSAFAGGAVVQKRRKQFAENVESTRQAMNETQAMLSTSSNNFKVRFPLTRMKKPCFYFPVLNSFRCCVSVIVFS